MRGVTSGDLKHRIRTTAPALFGALKWASRIRPSYKRAMAEHQQRVAAAVVIDREVRTAIGSDCVQAGPFQGLELSSESVWSTDWAARVLGTYEMELHPHFADVIASGPPVVVDVGCADGYVAVGLARALPEATVRAYDIDESAQAATRKLAALNGVSERVAVHGRCDPSDLMSLPPRSLVVIDCEGAETAIVSDEVARSNPAATFVIECHDFMDHAITDTLLRRFAGRDVVRVAVQPRRAADAPMIPPDLAARALDEHRSTVSSWLVVRAESPR